MSTRNIEFINTFKWKGQIIKEHKLLVDCDDLHMILSIDGIGSLNEYFRSPSVWDECVKVMKYFDSLIDLRKNKRTLISVRSTVYIYNVNKLKDIELWFKQHFPRFENTKRNICVEPTVLSIKNIPKELKDLMRPVVESYGKDYIEVLNMLNTKYIVFNGNNGPQAQPNPEACGNAWFVQEVQVVNNANEAMTALNARSIGDTAAVAPGGFKARTKAIVQSKDWTGGSNTQFLRDSAAAIQLSKYGLNGLSFTSNNAQAGFAVFSDVYYPLGWKAYVDGKETPIVATNYVLRGLMLPAGQHQIEFKFHPDTYFKWSSPTLAASVLIWLVLLAGVGFGIRNARKPEEQHV
jgi:hypothetical protein